MDNEGDATWSAMGASYAAMSIHWGHIENNCERVLIVAAGPSLRSVNRVLLQKACSKVRTIVVNAAVGAVPMAADWFSLDFDARTRSLAKQCGSFTRVIAAVPGDFGTPDARVPSHRCMAPGNVLYLKRIEGEGPLKSKYGLSNDPSSVHTGNSVWGALGVAWHMKPKRICILGLDANTKPGWPGNHRPRELGHLDELFASALPQLAEQSIEIRNGNIDSLVHCFPRISSLAALNWIGN